MHRPCKHVLERTGLADAPSEASWLARMRRASSVAPLHLVVILDEEGLGHWEAICRSVQQDVPHPVQHGASCAMAASPSAG